jgi:GNAT superfamily N-acetyltransferase
MGEWANIGIQPVRKPIFVGMSPLVRPARPEDFLAVHQLIGELADFERAAGEFTLSLEQLLDDYHAGRFQVLVAEVGGIVAGMALYFDRYSTWKGRCLYLEDLIVSQPFRGQGLGQALLSAVIREARNANAARLEWMVLDWNEPAIDFYNRAGASLEREWLLCRMDALALQQANV